MEAILSPNEEFKLRREKAQRNLMWLGIGSIVMIFAGLTSAYVVRRGQGDWMSIDLPSIFWVSSAVIVFSSVTMNFALWGFKSDRRRQGSLMLGLTLLLGMAFAWCQLQGWQQLVGSGVYLVHPKDETSLISGSFIYLLSGLHLAHLAGGLLALIFTLVKSLLGKYNSNNVHGVRVAAIYWHFLGFLWIYLFVFLTVFK